jgi:uncharacterized membrane protein YvbJ
VAYGDEKSERFTEIMGKTVGERFPAILMFACRECDNEINEGTEICPHCGADLTVLNSSERAAKKMTLRKILVRWVPLLGVLVGAIWIFIWFAVKHRIR